MIKASHIFTFLLGIKGQNRLSRPFEALLEFFCREVTISISNSGLLHSSKCRTVKDAGRRHYGSEKLHMASLGLSLDLACLLIQHSFQVGALQNLDLIPCQTF